MFKLLGLIIAAAVMAGAILGGGFLWDAFVAAPAPDAQETSFIIEEGQSSETIAKNLAAAGFIKGAWPFRAYLAWSKTDKELQAGTFALKPGMSYAALAAALIRAAAQEVQVTIPEGFTLKQIGAAMRDKLPAITEESWQAAVGPESPLKATAAVLALIPKGQGLEGYLFPDTYRFRADADAATVAAVLVQTLERRLGERGLIEYDDLSAAGFNLHQALTLASILEREVRTAEEMKNVADIFLKRLKIGLALQADSTVNYVTGKDTPGISLTDTKIDSPYNTYQRVGLPPGPIGNPGLTAIDAAVNPTPNAWYYFLTDADGQVYYAKTFDEHVANKNKYRR